MKVPTHMRRRRFLRGAAGVAVGLPFLETFAPRKLGAQQAAAIKRFGVFFCCNGVNMDRWFPEGDFGALTDAHLTGTANEALVPFLDRLLFPRGVHMSPRGFGRDGGGGDDHGKGMAHKLTAQFADDDEWLALGPSVDQVIAAQINPGSEGSRRPPLNLMVGRRGTYRGLAYSSYTGAGQAVAAVNNPWSAYSELMSFGADVGGAAGAENLVATRRQSVLDLVGAQFDELRAGPLSVDDRAKLDAHFTAIRELEIAMSATGLSCGDTTLGERASVYEFDDADGGGGFGPSDPAIDEAAYPDVSDIQMDIFALALACDYTRVATLQFGNGSGGPTFTWDGMSHEYNHHKLSHGKVRDDCFGDSTDDGCDDVVGYEDMIYDIDVWHQGKYARLLERLDSYVEEDGRTLLDNSVVMYTNELSDGKGHSFIDLPYILAGSAGGYFKQGQYVLLGSGDSWDDQQAPHNKLLNTLVNAMDIESDWFGVEEGAGGETMQGGVYEQLLL